MGLHRYYMLGSGRQPKQAPYHLITGTQSVNLSSAPKLGRKWPVLGRGIEYRLAGTCIVVGSLQGE